MDNINIIDTSKEYVKKLLEPLSSLDYHKYSHSGSVAERCTYLARAEGITWDDLEILLIAAIFHDTGYIVQYFDNELLWAKIARNFLMSMSYPEDKIEAIWELILATEPNYRKPKNKLEEIIKDSDSDNFWRTDFIEIMWHVKTEFEVADTRKYTDAEWHDLTLRRLLSHRYYTETQKNERDQQKLTNIEILNNLLK